MEKAFDQDLAIVEHHSSYIYLDLSLSFVVFTPAVEVHVFDTFTKNMAPSMVPGRG